MDIIRRAIVDDAHLQGIVADPILRQVLARRGVLSQSDLNNSLKELLPPFLLKDIDKASEIIAKAVMAQKRILIAGDYDIDGMTGTALGVRALKAFGLHQDLITYYVPSRYHDGYGLNTNVVEQSIRQGIDLIITVDNGIAAFEAVNLAKQHNLTVVVTDHHEVQGDIPCADAVVNPKRKDDVFPSKNLCGVGVLFYVLVAARAKLREYQYFSSIEQMPNMADFLDLVALGTIGDVMSLDSNNRRLVKAGLDRIHHGLCSPGLSALLDFLKLDKSKVHVRSIAFDLCPRFNAATRIKIKDNPAILTLLSDNKEQALLFAKQLDMCNKRRVDHEKVMLSKALELYFYDLLKLNEDKVDFAEIFYDHAQSSKRKKPSTEEYEKRIEELSLRSDCQKLAGLVLFDPCFLTGVVGLVANRMKERYALPCVIFGADLGAGADGMVNIMQQAQKDHDTSNIKQGAEFAHLDEAITADDFIGDNAKYKLSGEQKIVGSARSIRGIDLMEVFSYMKAKDPDVFIACGGHAIAAGATIYLKNLESFKILFSEACIACQKDAGVDSSVLSDYELPHQYLCLDFAKDLEALGPWGKDFEEPKFDGVFVVDSTTIMAGRHLKLKIKLSTNKIIEAIKFRANAQEKAIEPGVKVRLVYTVTIDRYYHEKLVLHIDSIEVVD